MGNQKILFLHIGHPKTGTSALQVFLAQNREILLQHNLDYPPIGKYEEAFEGGIAAGNGRDISDGSSEETS